MNTEMTISSVQAQFAIKHLEHVIAEADLSEDEINNLIAVVGALANADRIVITPDE